MSSSVELLLLDVLFMLFLKLFRWQAWYVRFYSNQSGFFFSSIGKLCICMALKHIRKKPHALEANSISRVKSFITIAHLTISCRVVPIRISVNNTLALKKIFNMFMWRNYKFNSEWTCRIFIMLFLKITINI